MNEVDTKILKHTIELAKVAYELNNYPIGALITDSEGNIVAEAHNTSFSEYNPAGHAELACFELAGELLMDKSKRHTLYSSLDPCIGCSFFLRYTNVNKVIWALTDPYKGGLYTLRALEKSKDDFNALEIIAEPDSVLKERSRQLMYKFLSETGKLKAAEHFK